jgi:Protein of unknown function (DUF3152)
MAIRGIGAALAVALAGSLALVGCAAPQREAAFANRRTPDPSASPTTPVSTAPTPTPSPFRSLRPRATLNSAGTAGSEGGRSSGSNDGVPAIGSGTFAVAPGGTDVVGAGATLVTYRIEVETGITWGANPVWTPDSFAAAADAVLADPKGWILSAQHPVTDAAQHMSGASWSFQRVSGSDYSVRILLATPGTVDKMCGSIGLSTNGQYSCRYGKIILINLRRWLNGAPGFAMNLDGYHTMVINHEMGHRLGFSHMHCPAAGTLAPIMMQETIDIGGCLPNAYPFAPDGSFLDGPYAP